jgi:hypothetical protein
LNQKLKRLIRQLGEAIHESVSGSEDIAGVVKDIRDQGFDVLLMLEATIGLNEIEGATPGDGTAIEAGADHAPFNSHDLNFLKSLRITVEDETPADEIISGEPDPGDTAPAPRSDPGENTKSS